MERKITQKKDPVLLNLFYEFLIKNIKLIAKSSHTRAAWHFLVGL